MSQKTMVAAALSSAMTIAHSFAIAQQTPQENACSSDSLSGKIVLHNFKEQTQSGAKEFKPLSETALSIQCGDRWIAEFDGDFMVPETFGYEDIRREKASITYKAGDLSAPISFTAGYLGEIRKLEGMFGAAGRRPDVGLGENLIAYKIDNPSLLGLIVKKSIPVQDGILSLESAIFGVADQEKNPLSLPEDRANSTTPSYYGKAKIVQGGLSYGIEGGRVQHGVMGNTPEDYVGIFGKYTKNLGNTVKWTSTAETLRFENFKNQDGVTRSTSVAYSNLEWTPEALQNLSLWGQIGGRFSPDEVDQGFTEIGARLDMIKTNQTLLSAIFAMDRGKPLEDDNRKSEWGQQVGVTLEHSF